MDKYDPTGSKEENPDELVIRVDDDTGEDQEQEEGEDKLEYDINDPEVLNLAEIFERTTDGKSALREIGSTVVDQHRSCMDATEGRRRSIGKSWRLFSGNIPEKKVDFPYPGAPNPHVPLMMIVLNRLHARLYSEIFADWQNIFGVRALDDSPAGKALADVLKKHGNWQIRSQIPDFRRQMNRLVLRHLVVGDTVVHSYWSDQTGTNRHEVLTEDNFTVPYQYTSTMPDMSDCPFLIKTLQYQRHELEQMRDQWIGVNEVLKNRFSYDDSDEDKLLSNEAKSEQMVESPDGVEGPRDILWYEGWLLLPKQENQRYMQVIVDKLTARVLSLKLHEISDWKDKIRFDREVRERDEYFMMLEQWNAGQQQMEMLRQQSEAAGVPVEEAMAQMPPPPPEPIPPKWMNDPGNPKELPRRVKTQPIRMFRHQVFIEPFEGNLGFSIGQIAASFNMLANVSFSLFSDQAIRANTQSFLSGDGPRIPTRIKIEPNGIAKIPGIPFGQIDKALMPLRFGQANPQLGEVISMVMRWSEEAFQSPEALGGAPGKSGEAYRGLVARIEQATKQLSVPATQISDLLEGILQNNATLNSLYLDDEELIDIADGVPNAETIVVSRKMYQRSYAVEITADKRFTSMAERIAEADEGFGMVKAVLQILGPSPQMFDMLKLSVVKAFESRGMKDMAAIARNLAPPQGPPAPPGGGPGGAGGGPQPPRGPAGPGGSLPTPLGLARGGPPKGASRSPEPQPGQAPGRVPAPPTPGATR